MGGITEWGKVNDDCYRITAWCCGAGGPYSMVEKREGGWVITLKQRRKGGFDKTVFPTFEEAMLACEPNRAVYGTRKWRWALRFNDLENFLNGDLVEGIAKILGIAIISTVVCLIFKYVIK